MNILVLLLYSSYVNYAIKKLIVMNSINLDNIIVITFLLTTLIIGLRTSKNIKDIAEYAIANKTFNGAILTITILATYITGSKGIGYAGYVFDDGILPVLSIIFCGVIFCFLFIIWFILPHIKYFDGCLTTAEIIGQVYGAKARFATGILGSFYSIVLVTLQIIWLGNIGELLSIPKLYSVIFVGTFLVIYSSVGGMKSVTITDVIQFIAITIMIPLIAYVVLNKVGGIKSLITQVPAQHFDILHHPHLKDHIIYCIWYIFPAFPLSFPFIQRMLMAKSNKQLTESYYISMLFLIVFFVLLTLIGLSAIVLQNRQILSADITGSQLITHLINNYFTVGARGVLAIGLIAMVMSTADSFLNSAGLLLVHDVIKPIYNKKNIDINELKLVRYTTLVLGVISVFWASINNILPRIQYAGIVDIGKGINIISEIIALIFTVPLIAGIMGLKGSTPSFFIPTSITTAFIITSKLLFDNELLMPTSVAVNLLSFFITHYILNGSFTVVRRERIFAKTTNVGFYNRLFVLLKSFSEKFSRYASDYDTHLNTFALFMAFNYMLPLFIYSHVTESSVYHWILSFRIIGGLMCVGLLLKTYWPNSLQVYFPVYYYLSLLFCLPFSTTLIFLIEKGSAQSLINVTISITLLIMIVYWLVSITLSVVGVLLAVSTYSLIFDNHIILNTDVIYLLAYTCFFSIVIGMIFVRTKQYYLNTLINNQYELQRLYSSTTDQLIDALNYQEKIARGLGKEGIEILQQAQKITDDLRKQVITDSNSTYNVAYNKLTSIMCYLDEVLNQAKNYVRLRVSNADINSLIKEINCEIVQLSDSVALTLFNRTCHKTIECDVSLVKKLLIDTIMQMRKYSVGADSIQVYIDSTELWYQLESIKDYTKKIPAIRFVATTLEEIGDLPNFYIGDAMKAVVTLDNKQDLYEVESIRIVNAHYGVLHSSKSNDQYCIIIVLPLRVRDVRPETMDLQENESVLQEVLTSTWKERKVEMQLIQDIRHKNPDANIEKIKTAIDLIKKYHSNQVRQSGEPFYTHPLSVAKILLQFTDDEDTILASLLHDIVEDTPMSLSKIEAMFNPDVAKLVNAVTKFDVIKEKFKLSEHETIQKLMEQQDKRALTIKIADRIHNMRTISSLSSHERQKSIAEQTLQVYIPIAKSLELTQAAEELNELVFKTLNKLNVDYKIT